MISRKRAKKIYNL